MVGQTLNVNINTRFYHKFNNKSSKNKKIFLKIKDILTNTTKEISGQNRDEKHNFG